MLFSSSNLYFQGVLGPYPNPKFNGSPESTNNQMKIALRSADVFRTSNPFAPNYIQYLITGDCYGKNLVYVCARPQNKKHKNLSSKKKHIKKPTFDNGPQRKKHVKTPSFDNGPTRYRSLKGLYDSLDRNSDNEETRTFHSLFLDQ